MENEGRKGRHDIVSSFEDVCKNKRGIVVLKNDEDNLCLARALVVALAFIQKMDVGEREKLYYKHIIRQDKRLQYVKEVEL